MDFWKRLRDAVQRLGRSSQRGSSERQTAKERARFWSEVREGQREAEARTPGTIPRPAR